MATIIYPSYVHMLKDIYARKPQAAASSTTTIPGASAPLYND